MSGNEDKTKDTMSQTDATMDDEESGRDDREQFSAARSGVGFTLLVMQGRQDRMLMATDMGSLGGLKEIKRTPGESRRARRGRYR